MSLSPRVYRVVPIRVSDHTKDRGFLGNTFYQRATDHLQNPAAVLEPKRFVVLHIGASITIIADGCGHGGPQAHHEDHVVAPSGADQRASDSNPQEEPHASLLWPCKSNPSLAPSRARVCIPERTYQQRQGGPTSGGASFPVHGSNRFFER